jgi:putative ABC transport system permease protein
VAVAALAASIVFGTNLVGLVDTPQRYGWPWDIGVLANFGYGGLDQARVHADLAARHDIASYDELGFFSAQAKGKNIPVLFAREGSRAVDLPLVRGRAPRDFSEVALGTDTAHELDVTVGDRLAVDYGSGPAKVHRDARVVGIAVFPSIGQTLADRTGLGHGLFTVVPASRLASTENGSDIDLTFVGITLKSGADQRVVADALRPRATPWDTTGQIPFVYPRQIRPPEIVNAEGIRNGPVLLAGLLGVALLIALALSIAVSVNARRRDLAVLRAMGFTRAQVRRSVHVQALTTVMIGIVVGLPVGVIAGRWSWRLFAEELGVAPRAVVPVVALLAISGFVVIGALAAAVRPAYVAARTQPAVTLRSQ